MHETTHELFILSDGEDKSSALKNRIRKNYQHLRKWAKKSQTDCFRIYDRDIKEYPIAIDYYSGNLCVHYFADEDKIAILSDHTIQVLCSLFNVTTEKIYERRRFRREKLQQYEKMSEEKEFFTVVEHGARFKVNLLDYLDTGLFLDHRKTRQMVASLARNKSLLNLFAYTCAFSVHAALAGAAFTKSVDLSNTYTAWGKQNFLINHIPLDHHEIIRADCLKFLDEEIATKRCYDLIVLDPPTLSRSKKMDGFFDIQNDYTPLVLKALQLLHPEGSLFFSTNSRQFKFDPSQFQGYKVQDISKLTLPIDFRSPKTHKCWRMHR